MRFASTVRRLLPWSLLAVAGCGSDAPVPATPTVVATPTPAPTPTPGPPVGNPMVRITANILGFTRTGTTYNFVPNVFRRGDVIDLDCTPRGADNQRTTNHPAKAEWYPNSTQGGLVFGRDYTMARDDTYQPDLFIRDIAPAGTINIYCKAQGVNISSNIVSLPVVP